MLLGGKGGCQQCTCVPCDACTRTCQNPYTGTEFEAVFTRYFEGAETGNVSDGYLTASGDSDTSDPYDGMDGSGPWYQQITGSFTLNSSSTRYPCYVRVSFWRNNYVLGASTIPPASTALQSNEISVTVSEGAVRVGDRVITPADGETVLTVIVPLVSGGGDQSTNDPRFYDGTIAVAPQCDSASFSVKARIQWNVQKRQHVLYGIVRECYEEGTPCATVCSGSAPPAALYLTISNLSVTSKTGGAVSYPFVSFMDDMKTFLNDTFVLDRAPNFCEFYYGAASGGECAPRLVFEPTVALYASKTGFIVYVVFGLGNTCRYAAVFRATIPTASQEPICDPYYKSGTSTDITAQLGGDGGEQTYAGTFDWVLES